MEVIKVDPSQAERLRRNQEAEDDLRLTKWRQVCQMLIVAKHNILESRKRGQNDITLIDPDDNNTRERILGKKNGTGMKKKE